MDREEFDRSIGRNARKVRESQGISQTDIVSASGGSLSQTRLSQLEKGARWSVWHIYIYAKVCGVESSSLLDGVVRQAGDDDELSAYERLVVATLRSAGVKSTVSLLLERLANPSDP